MTDMPRPAISVVVPAFEAGETIRTAVASIVIQTLPDWECIVVDDGSTVPVAEALAGLDDDRVRVVRIERNAGRGAARNAGVAAARGRLIAWQDADDWSLPDRLATLADYMDAHAGVGLAAPGVYAMLPGGEVRAFGPAASPEPRRLAPLEHPPFVAPAAIARRELVARLGFRATRVAEDHDFLIRALRDVPFGLVPARLYAYDQAGFSLGKYVRSQQAILASCWREGRRHPLPLARRTAGSLGRVAIFTAGELLGQRRRLLRRRFRPLPAGELDLFEAERRRVAEAVQRLWGGRRASVSP